LTYLYILLGSQTENSWESVIFHIKSTHIGVGLTPNRGRDVLNFPGGN